MAPYYQTLQTIYNIVKNDAHPTTYPCSTREIILWQASGWTAIEEHLQQLEIEQLIIMKKLDRMVICITSAGIETIQLLNRHEATRPAF
jgi:hypothetical protein